MSTNLHIDDIGNLILRDGKLGLCVSSQYVAPPHYGGGRVGALSPYAYCGGDPVNFIDPTGCEFDSASMQYVNMFERETNNKIQKNEATINKLQNKKQSVFRKKKNYSFSKTNAKYGVYDLQDEVEAYARGALYGGSKSLQRDYSGLNDGPLDVNSVVINNREFLLWLSNRDRAEAYAKQCQGAFRYGNETFNYFEPR